MNKVETIEGIVRARQFHEIQMKKIKTIGSGVLTNNPTPMAKTECDFGKWLYDENNRIKDLLGDLFYSNIETLHSRWHDEYARIYNMLYKKKKGGLFTNMFGGNKVTDMEIDKAKLYYSELETTTNELLKAIDLSQKRLHALPESKFS